MKSKAVVCAIAALSMSFSTLTFAQQDKDVRAENAQRDLERQVQQQRRIQDRGHASPPQRAPDRGRVDDRRGDDRRGDDRRGDDRRGYDRSRFEERRGNDYDRGREWRHRGGQLPMEYRSRSYVVDDWRGHRLSAPPRGYQWVQAGNDYLLVAITTGIIASILLNQ